MKKVRATYIQLSVRMMDVLSKTATKSVPVFKTRYPLIMKYIRCFTPLRHCRYDI